MTSSASHGQVAYEAYKASRGGQTPTGAQLPEWDDQPDEHAHWHAAAAAVSGHGKAEAKQERAEAKAERDEARSEAEGEQ